MVGAGVGDRRGASSPCGCCCRRSPRCPGWPARATAESGISRWVSGEPAEPARRPAGAAPPDRPGRPAGVRRPASRAPRPGPPPAASPLSTAVTQAVAASTVKVEGQACNRIYEGSGFAVGPDLVVTNAHVVAGEPPGQTAVLLPSGRAPAGHGGDVRSPPGPGPAAGRLARRDAALPLDGRPRRGDRSRVRPSQRRRTRWPSPRPGWPRRSRPSGRTSTTAPTPRGTSWSWPPPWPTGTPGAPLVNAAGAGHRRGLRHLRRPARPRPTP